jgi:predicted amino acid-binding ACT domain protein
MIRYVYHKLTGRNTPKRFLEFQEVRGLADVKEANVSYPEIVDALDKEGERLGVSIRIQREDIFDAMHKI